MCTWNYMHFQISTVQTTFPEKGCDKHSKKLFYNASKFVNDNRSIEHGEKGHHNRCTYPDPAICLLKTCVEIGIRL